MNFRSFYKLKSVVGFDGEAVLIPEEVGVIGEDAVISSPRHRNAEGSVHIIRKLQLEAETHGFVEFPRQVDSDLLLGDADVQTLWETKLDSNVGDVVDELTLQVTVLVAVV